MRRLQLATCSRLPEPDPDQVPLINALEQRGIDYRWIDWRATAVDPASPTLIRSTWDYSEHIEEFLGWCHTTDGAGGLINPARVIEQNVHKSYLLKLAQRGVATVPTELIPAGADVDLEELCRTREWTDIVIKPAVGAGSRGVCRFRLGDGASYQHARQHLQMWQRRDALIQPYMKSTADVGERSLIWIDGAFTHQIRKHPRFAGDSERITGPYAISEDEMAVAEAAIAPYAKEILYGRVDLVRSDSGNPCVAELELTEPSLFFATFPPALDRLLDALCRKWLA